ncbi:MAG: 50S ribosomal protein L17 [Lentisphaeria bacterium]|nr:50S ribosomal protein L17 [Lentisphaeria bacterium]
MRHRKRKIQIGRRPDHVRALFANQVCSLIENGRICTTITKAKETRRLAEKMITLGKKGTLHHRRLAISKLGNTTAVHKLFEEVAGRFQDVQGGYTRIIRCGQRRRGDGAEMCYLELTDYELPTAEEATEEAEETTEEVVEAAAE